MFGTNINDSLVGSRKSLFGDVIAEASDEGGSDGSSQSDY